MSIKHGKHGKKHHHHHDKHSKVVAPKKTKTKSNDKRHKKKEGTKKKTVSRLTESTSKVNANEVKKEDATVAILPGITSSDVNVNMITEQCSAPTKCGKTPIVPETPPAISPGVTTGALVQEPTPPMKWKAEDVALKYIDKMDAVMTRLEFTEVCSTTQVNIDRDCQIWKKNYTKNQSEAFPVLDATLVKFPNQPDDYVNLSSITVPHCRYPVLVGQIPKKGLEEEFWRATFQENVVMMYVLIGSETEKIEFFPNEAGGFLYYGNMFVNIRKVEKMDDERTRYTIEILPNGMSNSNIINVYVHTGWEPFAVPLKYANTTRSVVDVMNFVKTSNGSEKLMVVSMNGAGRSGFFLSLGAAFCCLNDLFEPRIVEIVKTIRLQRPNAVASMKQYASLYLCLLYYIKKKSTIPESMKPKLEDVTKALEALIREDLSIIY